MTIHDLYNKAHEYGLQKCGGKIFKGTKGMIYKGSFDRYINKNMSKEIYEYDGIKYKIVLGPEDCKKPCDLCEMRKECEEDKFDDLFMLCGCEFCTKPYYCVKVPQNDCVKVPQNDCVKVPQNDCVKVPQNDCVKIND